MVKATRTREVKPALMQFGWLLLGVAIVAIYNVAVVGSDPLLGGYATVNDIQITNHSIGFWVTNLASALADPQRGVLTISPFILWLLVGVRKGWSSAAP